MRTLFESFMAIVFAVAIFACFVCFAGCDRIRGFDYARCLLEPSSISYGAEGARMEYDCGGVQGRVFEVGTFDLPEDKSVECTYVLHDFHLPIADPPAFIWVVEGSDARCKAFIERGGLHAEPNTSRRRHFMRIEVGSFRIPDT